MLTGETPWKAKNEKELLRKIENEPIEDMLCKHEFGHSTKEFLRKTLRVDKNSRLALDGVAEFTFGQAPSINILTEKKLNIDLKTNSSNTYFINAFTPKTDKVGENRALI